MTYSTYIHLVGTLLTEREIADLLKPAAFVVKTEREGHRTGGRM